MKTTIKKISKLILIALLIIVITSQRSYSLGWLGLGNQEQKKLEEQNSHKIKTQNSPEIEELNKEITNIFYEELEKSKQNNKDFIIKIISEIQFKLNDTTQTILERIISKTENSNYSNSMEYKITNHFAKVLNKLRQEVFSSNFSEKISHKLLSTNLLNILEEENITQEEIEEKSTILKDNIVQKSTEIFSNAFSENVNLIKINLDQINLTNNKKEQKEIINKLIDSLILNTKNLALIIIDQIITDQIENFINYLLQDSSCLTRTAARPVIKKKIIQMLNQYLENGLTKAKESKQLIRDYALPHLNEICKNQTNKKSKFARKKRSQPSNKKKEDSSKYKKRK